MGACIKATLLQGLVWPEKPLIAISRGKLPFARPHFGGNFCYHDDNATPHHSRVETDYLQQEDITNMDQPTQSSDCNHIENLWDGLGRAINNIDHPPHNLHELRYALLDQWANIPVESLHRLVASMHRRLPAIGW